MRNVERSEQLCLRFAAFAVRYSDDLLRGEGRSLPTDAAHDYGLETGQTIGRLFALSLV